MINEDTQGHILIKGETNGVAGHRTAPKDDPEDGGYFTASLVAIGTIFLTTTIVFLGLWLSERGNDDELKESVDELTDSIMELQEQLSGIVPPGEVTEPPSELPEMLNVIPEDAFPMKDRVSNADDSYVLKPRGEYFDIVSDTVSMKYGDTFWSNLPPIVFPEEIRDMDKLEVVGFEASIWEFKNGQAMRVPAYDVYNHHVNVYYNTPTVNSIRNSVLGAEMGGTFDYAVEGTTFTVDDPYSLTVEPMLIYTGKPGGGRCTPNDPDCPMPATVAEHPDDADWNPLLECPCTDQTQRTITKYTHEQYAETCPVPIDTAEACLEAGIEFGAAGGNVTTVNSDNFASGCSIKFHDHDGKWEPQMYFNLKSDSTAKCNEQSQSKRLVEKGNLLRTASRGEVEFYVDVESLSAIHATLVGPADRWFGQGFNSPTGKMVGTPAFIALTDGSLELRVLGDHTPGNTIPLEYLGIKEDEVSSEVVNGIRTVKFTMNLVPADGTTTQAPGTTTQAPGTTANTPGGVVDVDWKIPMETQAMTAVAGDTIRFEWNAQHNVYQMPNKEAFDNCDFTDATEIGSTSPVDVKFTGETMYFACKVPYHCSGGNQKVAISAEGATRRMMMEPKLDMTMSGMVNTMMGALMPRTIVDGQLMDTAGQMADAEHPKVAPAPVTSILQAVGFDGTFAYHGTERASGLMYSFYEDVNNCICEADLSGFVSGTIGGVQWGTCQAPFHPEQLIEEKNNICSASTYAGGQKCCPGGTILLDKAQVDGRPQTTKNVFLKIRIYHEPNPADDVVNVAKLYYPAEGPQAEYDIPKTESGEHELVVERTVSEIMGISAGEAVDVYFLQGHCHAPQCISQEFHVKDPESGEERLVCRTEMVYGTNDEALTEKGYIVGSSICLFGNEPGLEPPLELKGSDIIVTKKKARAEYPHFGDMAGWAHVISVATHPAE